MILFLEIFTKTYTDVHISTGIIYFDDDDDAIFNFVFYLSTIFAAFVDLVKVYI